jgi:hypothetical protein
MPYNPQLKSSHQLNVKHIPMESPTRRDPWNLQGAFAHLPLNLLMQLNGIIQHCHTDFSCSFDAANIAT